MFRFPKSRRARKIGLVVSLALLLLYLFRTSLLIAGRDFFYVTRPIWDSPTIPKNRVAHFHANNISSEKLCQFHGWTVKPVAPRVIDAFIFSIELDMLEIRLKELWNVVDVFVLVEANRSFTGREKRLFFNDSKERFSWAEGKVIHLIVNDLSPHPENSFDNELKTRRYMMDSINKLKPKKNDLIIVGDVDELPYAHTIQLLKTCKGYPGELHLELQNYLYSFEFRLQTKHFRQHVSTYDASTFNYHHGLSASDYLLADAGWHCSFCFRNISDFIFKMTSYSHSDRVTKPALLKPENIQLKICEGVDIYDMLPEVYSFQELMTQWRKPTIKIASTIGIPEYIVQNADKFYYLLPGGCIRDGHKK